MGLVHIESAKIHTGANGAITQYFYSAQAYLRFVEDCAGLAGMFQ
jgi:5,10-methylenetetrahydrofolate reductase